MKQLLKQTLPAMGIDISEEAYDMLAGHWDMLMEANAKFNLTAIKDKESACIKHYADSLAALPLIDKYASTRGDRVWDIGTGGGFPGMVLAMCRPNIDFLLLDSTGKKCNFLEEVKDRYNLWNVYVLCARAEEAGRDCLLRETAAVVTARAMAPLNVLTEYAMPLMRVGGVLLAYKGSGAEEELAQAQGAFKEFQCVHEEDLVCPLPNGDFRTILPIRKTQPTAKKYPRANGVAKKKPL